MSCFRGVQYCDDEKWGECTDGEVTREPLPETADAQLGRRSLLAYSSPVSCSSVGGAGGGANQFYNPCDPGCMFYDEDVPLNAGGAGMTSMGGVPDWGSPPATAACTHQLCETGAPLDSTCHPCVEQVCAVDATCCTGSMADTWDQACVDLVYTECAGTPPPVITNLCDFAAFGDVSVRLGNSSTGRPNIGSNGWVTPEPPASLGPITAVGTVNLRNGANVLGDVITEGSLWIEAGATLVGDVWAGGRVDVRNNAVITGDAVATGLFDFAANGRVTGDLWGGSTLSLASNATIQGNAMTVGTMTGQSPSYINGNATVNPPSMIDSNIVVGMTPSTAGPVAIPDPPVVNLPTVAAFDRNIDSTCAVANARTDINISSGNLTLPPGVYGDVTVFNPYQLILQEGGSYVFNSLNFYSGSHLRLAGSAPWDVSVCGEYRTDNGHTVYLNGTSTPPNGQDFVVYSDSTNNPCIYIGDNNIFNGILIAPNCGVEVKNGTTATAAVWGRTVYSDTGFALTNIPSADCEGGNQWGTSICDGTTPYYADGASYSNGDQVHYQGQIYECLAGGWCTNGSGFGGGPGYWPGEGADWTNAWILVGACPAAPDVPTGGGGACPATIDIPATNGPYTACYSGLECQVNSRCTEVLTDVSCDHTKCLVGPALNPSCDPCVERVCDVDASCCTDTGGNDWDATCVSLVETVCDATCGAQTSAGCAHDACVTGTALDSTCNTAVAGVCATAGFAYCCDTGTPDVWDQACIDQLYIQETGSAGSSPAPGETICDYAVMGAGTAVFNSATIEGDVGWFNGSIAIQEQSPGLGSTVDGDLYTWGSGAVSCTTLNGDMVSFGSATIDGATSGPWPCSTVSGTLDQPTGSLPTVPPRPDYSALMTCPTSGTDNYSLSGAFAPGVYGNIQLSGDITLSPGDYYLQTFSSYGNFNVTLPADPNDEVNFYVCGNIEIQGGTDVLSPGNNPVQAVFYSHLGTINVAGWAYSEVWGFLQANSGTITLSPGGSGVDLYGLAHSYYGIVQGNYQAHIDATGFSRTDCLNRGIDTSITVTPCPITTDTTGTVAESGTCVDNGDMHQVSVATCADVDLALDLPCDDDIPVCNHGNTTLPANEAEITFYPRAGQQFGVESPDPTWAIGSCAITNAIPAGTCVDQPCPPSLVNQDLTAMVNLTSGASVNECSELDNWTYYVNSYTCASGGSATVEVQAYEAVCPEGTIGTWGFLTWDADLMGADTVTFEARTSEDGVFAGGYTLIGTAETAPTDTSDCPLTSSLAECPVDISDALWPAGRLNQPSHLELRITLNQVGADIPAVNDWGLTYTCQYDQ